MRRLLVGIAAVLLTAGCGVPASAGPEVLSTTAVPYNLLQSVTPSPSSPRTGAPTPSAAHTVAVEVAFVVDGPANEQQVMLQKRRVPAGSPIQVAQNLLTQLHTGPTEAEHTQGLGSAIAVGSALVAAQVSGGLVVIHVTGDSLVQASDRVPLAVAQIVLTATSQPGVDRVLLLQDGKPLDPPLPDGTLTSGKELTRHDYQSLIQ